MKDSPELMPVNVVELKVSKAVSQLLASTSEQPGEDQESWGPERQAAVDEAEKAVETAVGEASDPAAEKSDVVLYTVACFYARLYVMEVIGRGELPSVGGVSEKFSRAVRCLAYAFARNPELTVEAIDDPDLSSIRRDVDELARALDWKIVQTKELSEQKRDVDRAAHNIWESALNRSKGWRRRAKTASTGKQSSKRPPPRSARGKRTPSERTQRFEEGS
ncbi:MAG: hypothetical protein M3301_06320 [Chloroflexota bacterium]|nr:hypothetical protein [Chloroflexota bacterium]